MIRTSNSPATVTLPSDTTFVVRRRFDAPPDVLFDAWTTPEHVRQWFAAGAPLAGCEIDLRTGGSWRYVIAANDGEEHAFCGEYREIDRPHRLVSTERYERDSGSEHVVSASFDPDAGGTVLTIRAEFPTTGQRDAWVDAGMEEGMNPGLDLLEALAIELAASGR